MNRQLLLNELQHIEESYVISITEEKQRRAREILKLLQTEVSGG